MATLTFPQLTGSEKQVAWAKQVRSQRLLEVRTMVQNYNARADRAVEHGKTDQATADAAKARNWELYTILSQQAEAHWWIERRDWTAKEILSEAISRRQQ